jgi:hypothetical protein
MVFTIGLKKLPFNPNTRQIIYVEKEYDEDVNRYILHHYDSFLDVFEARGFEFVYLPKFSEDLCHSEAVLYYVPNAAKLEESINLKSDYLLQYMEHPENRSEVQPSLLLYDPDYSNANYSRDTYLFRGIPIKSAIVSDKSTTPEDLLSLITPRRKDGKWDVILRSLKKFGRPILEEEGGDYPPAVASEELPIDSQKRERRFDEDIDEDVFDAETMALIRRSEKKIEEIKKEIGFRIDTGIGKVIWERIIYGEAKPSRLIVTTNNKILLPDYDKEIELTPILKAFYFLYLKHPEGIEFNLLPDHKDELLELYKRIKSSFFSRKAIGSIEKIMDYESNYRNETRSKINAIIRGQLDERFAAFYYIAGKKGDSFKISLPQHMITWE